MTVAWTEAWSSFTPAGTGWQDYDLYTNNSVPKGAVAYILILNNQAAAALTAGVRTDGSSLDRFIKVHEAEPSGNTTIGMWVKSDTTTGRIQTYASAVITNSFVLAGYLTGVDFTERFDALAVVNGTAGWRDWDLGAYGVPAGRVVSVAVANHTDGSPINAGVQTKTAGTNPIDRYFTFHEAESSSSEVTDCSCHTVSVKANDSSYVQYYRYSAGTLKYYVLGYFDDQLDYVEYNLLATYRAPIAANDTWTDHNVSSFLDQPGRLIDASMFNIRTGTASVLGARVKGSSTERSYQEHEAEDGYFTGCVLPTMTDANGVYQARSGNGSSYYRNGIYGYYKWSTVTGQSHTVADTVNFTDAAVRAGGTAVRAVADALQTADVAVRAWRSTAVADAVGAVDVGYVHKPVTEPTPAVTTAAADASTITTAVAPATQRKLFRAQGRLWLVYGTGGAMVYRTFDGEAWSAPEAFCDSVLGYDVAIATDGTAVHYVRGYGSPTLYYRRGTLNSNGTIAWTAAENSANAGGSSNSVRACIVDSTGAVVYAYQRDNYVWINKTTSTNGTWSNAAGFPAQVSTDSDASYWAHLIALGAGKWYLVYGRPATTYKGRLFSGSLGSEETVSAGTAPATMRASLTADAADNVYFGYSRAPEAQYLGQVVRRDAATGAWGAEETVQPFGANYAATPLLSTNKESGELYVLWADHPDAEHIYYRRRSALGDWDSVVDAYTESAGIPEPDMCCVMPHMVDGGLGFAYESDTSAPYTVKVFMLALPPSGPVTKDAAVDAVQALDAVTRALRRMMVSDALVSSDDPRRSWRRAIIADVLAAQDAARRAGRRTGAADGLQAADAPRRSHRRGAVPDAMAATDAASRPFRRMTAADVAALTDAPVRTRLRKAVSDAAAAQDAVARTRRVMVLLDELDAVDAVARTKLSKYVADAVDADDALVRSKRVMAVLDALATADSATLAGLVALLTVADAMGAADAVARPRRRMAAGDVVSAGDATLRARRVMALADVFGLADVAQLGGLKAILSVMDTMTAGDAVLRSERLMAVADALDADESLWKLRRTAVADAVSSADSPRRSWRHMAAADALDADDALWRRRYVAAVVDAVDIEDAALRTRRLMALADSLAASDAARRALRVMALADALSATDALQKIRRMAVADTVGAQEAQSRSQRRMSIADGLVAGEALWKRRYVAALADAMVASDAIATPRKYKFVGDAATAADVAARTRQRKFVGDQAAFADVAARVRLGKFVADAANFADLARIVARRLVAVDVVAMADYGEFLGAGSAIYDALHADDAAVRSWRSTLTVDAVQIVDAAARARRRMAIADGLSMADAAYLSGRRMAVSDSAAATDAVWKHRYLAALDSARSSDAAYRPRRSTRASDLLAQNDAAVRAKRRMGIGDLCAFTDVAQLMGAGMYAQDAFLASDAAVRALRRLSAADNATLADAALRSRRRTAASDALLLTDAVRRSIRRMAASDVASAVDQAAMRAKHKAAADYLGAVEAVWMRRTLRALDTLTAADSTSRGTTLHIVTDALRITDAALLRTVALVFELLAEVREAAELMAALGEAALWGEVDVDRYLAASDEEHELRAGTANEKDE
jgi:hypothetical protein